MCARGLDTLFHERPCSGIDDSVACLVCLVARLLPELGFIENLAKALVVNVILDV